MCFVKTNPDGGAGRAAGCDLGGALKGKNWEKIGRKQGEFFPPINISAGEWEKLWFLRWAEVNFYLSDDVKKRSQR